MSDFKRYNDGGSPYGADSSVGEQIVQEAYWRKAIVDAQRDMYFMPLAQVKDMPRNSGKTMKANVYIPVLDDRNLSDEGIDAAGNLLVALDGGGDPILYVYQDNVVLSLDAVNFPGADANGGYAWNTDFATTVADIVADYDAVNGVGAFATDSAANGFRVDYGYSNMYGSSRDPGVITAKLPQLAEGAQRVNRVGSTRVLVEGSIAQFGFFTEYTEESIQFDTDAELLMHITTEMMHAAVENTEDTLQRDLLNSAGTIRYAGNAGSKAAIAEADQVGYNDFVQLAITLDLNRTPKHTNVITGSRMIDTKTVNAARFMYIAPEQRPALEALSDYQGNKALIDVKHYAGQTTVMNGEIGSIHDFRIIVNPEMQYDLAGGAAIGAGAVYNDGVNVSTFPMLVVGEDSFSTIGFMSDGNKRNTKFTIHHMKPGRESVTRENPYGNMGLMSIRWWYGFLLKRPERIAVIWTAVLTNPTPTP